MEYYYEEIEYKIMYIYEDYNGKTRIAKETFNNEENFINTLKQLVKYKKTIIEASKKTHFKDWESLKNK